MNIETAIITGTKVLKERLIPTPSLDSEILLAKVINKDRKYVVLNSKKKN